MSEGSLQNPASPHEGGATHSATELSTGDLPLRSLVSRKPLLFVPDTPLRDALFSLNQAAVQAGVVAEEGSPPLGLIALRDLIAAITHGQASLDDPVFAFMTAAPMSLPADASVHRAKVVMTRSHLHHLVLLDKDGGLCNLLSQADLPGFREGGADALVETIEGARDIAGMTRAVHAVRQRAADLFIGGMGVETLSNWLSGLNDLISIRVIELIADEHDLPPVSWNWMVFGSEGRLEQTFATDQDNGLIFQPDRPEDTDRVRAAFLPFTQAVNKALHTCGFELCRGNVMAGNAHWCLSVKEWQARYTKWLAVPSPEATLHSTIFFDFRPLYGQDELVDDLRRWLLPQPGANQRFLHALRELALSCSPALNLFGRFAYDDRKNHPHTIDLKRFGARPFADAARIWSLQFGIWETNTADRLRAVAAPLGRSLSDTAAAIEAFDLIQRLRFQQQLVSADPQDANRVDPSDLNELQRLMLKEALKQAKHLQLRLKQDQEH